VSDYAHLVNNEPIETWRRQHVEVEARLAAATAELADAQAKFESAKDDADESISKGAAAALEAEDVLAHAIRVLKIARRIHDAATIECQTSGGARRAAAHRAAHGPVARAAFVKRAAAVRRAERLMSELKDADAEYFEAGRTLSGLGEHLGTFPAELGIGSRLLTDAGVPAFSAATHEARLRDRGIDPLTGAAGWL